MDVPFLLGVRSARAKIAKDAKRETGNHLLELQLPFAGVATCERSSFSELDQDALHLDIAARIALVGERHLHESVLRVHSHGSLQLAL